jgi:hypothetical protein
MNRRPESAMDRETTVLELLDQAVFGRLEEKDQRALERSLAADPQLVAEQRRLLSLQGALTDDHIAVRPDFHARVMADLGKPAWQHAREGWRFALAALLVCSLGAAFLLRGFENHALAGTGLAILDFLSSSLLAGSGMLWASWQGLGFGLEKLIADSSASLAAFATFVVFLDLLFVSMWRRSRKAAAPKSDAP